MSRHNTLAAAAIFSLCIVLLARWGSPVPAGPAATVIPAAVELLAGLPGASTPQVLFATPAGKRSLVGDLNGDGIREEYTLHSGRLRVATAGGIVWQTPPEWLVTECLLGDATGDGIPDLLLSVWKVGSFGPHKPFWVSGEDATYRNHLFIFKLTGDAVKAAWQSSDLARPNHAVFLSDLDRDGRNELIALEGSYDDPKAARTTVWRWNGWGFSFVE